jgi:hypothetical protein
VALCPGVHRIDPPVFHLTSGRATFASALSGLPVVILTTTGGKSGRPRTIPLIVVPDRDGVAPRRAPAYGDVRAGGGLTQ